MELSPMMDAAEIDVIRAFLKPEAVMFEYGSGGSTREWAKYVKKVYAAEHIAVWAERVAEALKDVGNVEILSRPPDMEAFDRLFPRCTKRGITEEGHLPDWCSPNFDATWRDAKEADRLAVFGPYVDAIAATKEARFDVVLVDSRCRSECALRALDFVDDKSVVIIHDWNLEEEGPIPNSNDHLKLPARKDLPHYKRVLDKYDVLCEVAPKTHPERCSRCGLVVLRPKAVVKNNGN
mmetsp:Transcript_16866/g.54908  ORF Transcript_16866/g.54908 Transcript_16866/m.54908 type:complete len:236 (-) Transcript_16866:156-863(-)